MLKAVELQKANAQKSVVAPSQTQPMSSYNSYGTRVLEEDRKRFMSKYMSFSERYGEVSSIEDEVPMRKQEEEVVPPSLEEDPNQSSLSEQIIQDFNIEEKEDGDDLTSLTFNQLKDKYKEMWGDKWVSIFKNKTQVVNAILELKKK